MATAKPINIAVWKDKRTIVAQFRPYDEKHTAQSLLGIGVEKVVSVTEHAGTFGPFSVVVWWYREFADADTPVVRASDENQNS